MLLQPKCHVRGCKHFLGVSGELETDQKVVCAAFPKGIPSEIAYGDNLHLKPYRGDNGIQYEPEDE